MSSVHLTLTRYLLTATALRFSFRARSLEHSEREYLDNASIDDAV